jgi:hypothetical protein
MNERDTLKHKLYFEKTHREVERKELESHLCQTKDEFSKDQKLLKDKVARLEEVSCFLLYSFSAHLPYSIQIKVRSYCFSRLFLAMLVSENNSIFLERVFSVKRKFIIINRVLFYFTCI